MAGTVKLTALRQLTGAYGTVAPGDVIEVDAETAESLESRGLAKRGEVSVTDAVLAKAAEKHAESQKATGPTENKAVAADETKTAAKK